MLNNVISRFHTFARKSSGDYLVIVATFIIMSTFAGTRFTFGVFFKPVINDFGWTRALTSGAFSLTFVTHGFASLVLGRMTDRYGPRVALTICAVFTGIGHILMSQISEVWQLYLFYGIIIGIGSSVHVPILSTIAKRFKNRRSMISGIVMSGEGAGQLVIPPLAAWMITVCSWRQSYIILGVSALLLMLISAQFLGNRSGNEITPKKQEQHEPDAGMPAIRVIARTKQFWIINILFFLLAFCAVSILVHIVPYITDIGIAPTAAAGVLAFIGIAIMIGRILLGIAADSIGEENLIAVCFILVLIALVGFLSFRAEWHFYLFAILFGLGVNVAILGSTLIARLWGLRAHATIFSIANFSFTAGAAISPYLFGYIHDVTDSYHLAFVTDITMALAGLVLAIILVRSLTDNHGYRTGLMNLK